MKESLYEISSAYRLLQQQLEEADEIAKENGTDVDSFYQIVLNSVGDQFEEKAENYAKIIRNMKADIKALKDEESRLAQRRKSKENAIKRLEENLFNEMNLTGKTNFSKGIFEFKIVGNGGLAPLKLKVNEDEIPNEYKIVSYEVNNKLLRKLAQDDPDNGICYIGERGKHLSIK